MSRWIFVKSAALWTPSDLADLRAWYKADSITGLSDGDPVSTWSDSSGGGYNITNTSTARPTYATSGLNSLPVVQFNGSQLLKGSSASDFNFMHQAGDGATIVAAWQTGVTSDPNTEYGLLGTSSANLNTRSGAYVVFDDRASVSRNDRIRVGVGNATTNTVVIDATADNAHPANAPQMLSVSIDPDNATAADRSAIRVNGGTAVAANTATGTPSTSDHFSFFEVGAIGGSGAKLVGYIAEIVICNAILSSTDREKAEGYLAHKWGLAANLPAGHPYKTSAPTV